MINLYRIRVSKTAMSQGTIYQNCSVTGYQQKYRQYRKKIFFTRSLVTHSHKLAVFSVKSKTSFLWRNNSMETPLAESSTFDVTYPTGRQAVLETKDSAYYSKIELALMKGKVVVAYSREKLFSKTSQLHMQESVSAFSQKLSFAQFFCLAYPPPSSHLLLM